MRARPAGIVRSAQQGCCRRHGSVSTDGEWAAVGLGLARPHADAHFVAPSSSYPTRATPPLDVPSAPRGQAHPLYLGVMSVLHLDEARGALDAVCAGNIGTLIAAHRSERRLGCTAATLGVGRPPRITPERVDVGPREAVILFSDGISSRATLDGEPELLMQHPIAMAQRLVERFGRPNDDAIVLVAR